MFLVGARLHTSTAGCLPTPSRKVFAGSLMQTRNTSRAGSLANQHKKKALDKKKNQNRYVGEDTPVQTRAKASGGAFLPMPPAQLKDKLFTEHVSTLKAEKFSPETFTPQNVAQTLEFPEAENNILRAYGVPRNLLVEFRLLSKPCSIIRDVTVSTIQKLNDLRRRSHTDTRAVLTGPRGCGKSMLLLQAVEYCVASGWIVLYIPRGISLVNSSTQYMYDARTRTYVQPAFSSELLRRFGQINSQALNRITLAMDVTFGKTSFRKGTPLPDLIKFAVETDQSSAPAVLEAVLAAVARQAQYPVLLAVDDIQALYRRTTLYRDPRFQGIKPYHLSVPRLLLEYAGGKKQFAKGAVLGALSCSDTTFQLPIELREALHIPLDRPSANVRRIPELVEYAKGLQNIRVPPQLHINEAASLYQVWTRDLASHSPINDDVFMTTYAQSSGNARDFVWNGLLSSFSL